MKAGLIICCLLLLSAGTCACSNGHGAGLFGRTDSMQKTYTVREISEGNGGIKHTPLEKALPSFCEESFERAEAPKEKESGLSAPSVQVQRFGISTDDEVFLMLMLSGSGNEQPVVLVVTEN